MVQAEEQQPAAETPEVLLKQMLGQVEQYGGDAQAIYPQWQKLLEQMTEALLAVLPGVAEERMAQVATQQQQDAMAWLLVRFATLMDEFPLGKIALNKELAIAAYEKALEVITQAADPEGWALIQNNLGNTYSFRIRGDRAENIEQAIAAYQNALLVYTQSALPQDWAMTQNNLGEALRQRIRGDRAENIELAIAAYQNTLLVRTQSALPQKWAMTQMNLGIAYSDRIRGDRAENIELAIAAYQNALQVRTQSALPQKWSMTQMNLGIAYRNRIRGDRAENIELAIVAYQNALLVYTQSALPQDWAMTQMNLGAAYQNRIRGDRAENIELAIAAYQNALLVYTQSTWPQQWAMTQGNLAGALVDLSAQTEDPSKLDEAIDCYEAALAVATHRSYYSINDHYSLGSALAQRYEQQQNPEDLRRALTAYRTALDAISPEHYNRDRYAQMLPQTQTLLGSRLVRDGQWQEGLGLLLKSLEQLRNRDQSSNQTQASSQAPTSAQATTLYEIGRAYEILSDWPNARLYYRDALRLFEDQADDLGTARSRSGLGSILVSQGFFDKGIHHLTAAQETFTQLDLGEEVDKVNKLIQAAQAAKTHQLAQKI